jgi:uncharacterized repeat protein (TIGR03803 family)
MPLRPIKPSTLTAGIFSFPRIQNRGFHGPHAPSRNYVRDRLTYSVLLFLAASFVTLLPTPASAQYTQAVLYNFCAQNGCTDGSGPTSTPLFDAHGNMYGVAGGGGANNDGVVYEMTPNGNGTWSESVLYSFCAQSNCPDGKEPYYRLAFDSQGNLYGTTLYGGSNNAGVVYELSPPPGGSGPWTESVLYNICQTTCPQGTLFLGGLVLDSHGNLYGVAGGGGTHGGGLVFELTASGGGSWTYTVIYYFCSLTNCADGSGPAGGLIFDSHGNLYGTTESGGANEAGAVFELTPGRRWLLDRDGVVQLLSRLRLQRWQQSTECLGL